MPERHPRINCMIPGCRRGSTRHPGACEIICARCWRGVSRETKAAYRRERGRSDDFHITAETWDAVRREATEAAAGL